MVKMEITGDKGLVEVLEEHPQLFPMFQQIGMCCVNEEVANCTIEEVCIRFGADPDSFTAALNQAVGLL
ncbi:MAG: DUF1858 domain-containing protein [Bacillota bacterium]|jgi:hypothetical protein